MVAYGVGDLAESEVLADDVCGEIGLETFACAWSEICCTCRLWMWVFSGG
jgi:hypothetical protein